MYNIFVTANLFLIFFTQFLTFATTSHNYNFIIILFVTSDLPTVIFFL